MMSGTSVEGSKHAKFCSKLHPAFALLLKAFEYAEDANSDAWEFAVEIRNLLELGLSQIDLRWLVRKGYVQHACEMTMTGDNKRVFRSTGEATFCTRTCFVLTKSGVSKARSLPSDQSLSRDEKTHSIGDNPQSVGDDVPQWDAGRRELRLNGILVKQFKWNAANQEMILAAFEEEDWTTHIDDPLPPEPEQDSKRRLSDTIKCLNRKQQHPLIHFRGDGTGEGVIWELNDGDAERQA
jgi:hypothetical protein